MQKVIVYAQDTGLAAVIWPTEEALSLHGIEAIAQKDVPAGKPYKIIDAVDIPTDRVQRAQWTVDAADLTDGIGGESNSFEGAQS